MMKQYNQAAGEATIRTTILLVHGTCLKEIVHNPGISTKNVAHQRQSIKQKPYRCSIATLSTYAIRQRLPSPTR